MQYFADMTRAMQTLRWLLGDLDVASYQPLLAALPMLVVACGIFLWLPRALNVLALGDDHAASRGVDVLRMQRMAFFSASLATGAAVSIGGPIGFVGIVVPHLVRLLVGADHRLVVPASLGFGAAFLVACDLISRTVLAPIELPVGIVTALIGGPFSCGCSFGVRDVHNRALGHNHDRRDGAKARRLIPVWPRSRGSRLASRRRSRPRRRRPGSSRWCRRRRRCSLPSAPGLGWSP